MKTERHNDWTHTKWGSLTVSALILVIGFALIVLLIQGLRAGTRETRGYKYTGLNTESGKELHYDEETKFVYEAKFNEGVWLRSPYITEYGAVYKYNEDTEEIYLDIEQIEDSLERLKNS